MELMKDTIFQSGTFGLFTCWELMMRKDLKLFWTIEINLIITVSPEKINFGCMSPRLNDKLNMS